MAESDVEEFEGSLFPVFVTADLPLDLINEIFKRSDDFTQSEEVDGLEALVLVTSAESFNPTGPTELPIAASAFEASASPFLGKSAGELQRIFEESIAPGDEEEETPKANNVFAVLDERTGRDKTVLLVSLEAGEAEGSTVVETIRCEPEIVAIVAMGPEMGVMGLTEGREDAKGADGVYVLTLDRYRKQMQDELDDEDDFDEDDYEGADDDEEDE